MDISKLKPIVELFDRSTLTEMDLEFSDIKLSLKKNSSTSHHDITLPTVTTQNNEAECDHTIVSPIVGTFYRAPSADAQPFVEVGQAINKGDVICVIEAMKVMNQIKSEVNGIVTDILIDNGTLVQFNQELIRVKTHD